MGLINWELIKNPANWVISGMMVLLVILAGTYIQKAAGKL